MDSGQHLLDGGTVLALVTEAERGHSGDEGPEQKARREALLDAANLIAREGAAGVSATAILCKLRARAGDASRAARDDSDSATLRALGDGWRKALAIVAAENSGPTGGDISRGASCAVAR